uniref:Uncharacterized protein n=1 Tax=Sphaerodactylus townsendi TaxID=933632 RepID=A0ACB8EWK9_9SAUR
MLLNPMTVKVHDGKCTIRQPLSSLHKHYQEGDLIIGGIGSHIDVTAQLMEFTELSSYMEYDMPLWTWIGLIIVDDERGERFQQAMLPLFSENGVCSAFIHKIFQVRVIEDFFNEMKKGWKDLEIVMKSKANAVVLFGDTASISYLRMGIRFSEQGYTTATLTGKVYIMTIQMDFASYYYQRDWDKQIFHGIISFTGHTNEPPGFQPFLQSRKPVKTPEDGYIREFWEQAFFCQFSDSLVQKGFKEQCTGEEKLESLPGDAFEMNMTGTSYSIYNAVYAVSYALHVLHSSPCGHRRDVIRERKQEKKALSTMAGKYNM